MLLEPVDDCAVLPAAKLCIELIDFVLVGLENIPVLFLD